MTVARGQRLKIKPRSKFTITLVSDDERFCFRTGGGGRREFQHKALWQGAFLCFDKALAGEIPTEEGGLQHHLFPLFEREDKGEPAAFGQELGGGKEDLLTAEGSGAASDVALCAAAGGAVIVIGRVQEEEVVAARGDLIGIILE